MHFTITSTSGNIDERSVAANRSSHCYPRVQWTECITCSVPCLCHKSFVSTQRTERLTRASTWHTQTHTPEDVIIERVRAREEYLQWVWLGDRRECFRELDWFIPFVGKVTTLSENGKHDKMECRSPKREREDMMRHNCHVRPSSCLPWSVRPSARVYRCECDLPLDDCALRGACCDLIINIIMTVSNVTCLPNDFDATWSNLTTSLF